MDKFGKDCCLNTIEFSNPRKLCITTFLYISFFFPSNICSFHLEVLHMFANVSLGILCFWVLLYMIKFQFHFNVYLLAYRCAVDFLCIDLVSCKLDKFTYSLCFFVYSFRFSIYMIMLFLITETIISHLFQSIYFLFLPH